MSLKEIIIENRPNISLSSVKTYLSIIRNLGRDLGVELNTPKDIIENQKKISELYKKLEGKIRKTRLSALIVALDGRHKDDDTNRVIEIFRNQMMKDGASYDLEIKEQTLTDKQKEGWMEWKDIMDNYTKLSKEVNSYFKTATELSKPQFKRAQLYVLLSCLLLIEPRRSLDYTEFKLRNETDKDNFMEIKGRKAYFVFNTYKTAKRYGQEKIEIPTSLKTIMNKWKVLNKSDYMLVSSQNKKINSTQLNTMLQDYFNRPLSTSLLRHIYLSNKYKDIDLKEMEKTASNMGHSVQQMMEYVKKA